MDHEINYNDGDKWLTCRIHGSIDIAGVSRFADAAIESLGKHPDCKSILCDARDATLPLSIIQIWQIPRILNEIVSKSRRYHDGSFFSTKRALLVSEHNQNWRFFETVTRNMGHSVRVFTDTEAAAAWLQE